MGISFFYKKITELSGELATKDVSLSELKRKTEILIIDDEEFSYFEPLQKHEYNITQKKDLTDLRDAEAFKIVLCDIRGVGNFLTSEFGGAYLIKQLKKKYPAKIIIAYTANEYSAKFEEFLSYADDIISKGSYALEDWTSLLDRLLKELADPIKIWDRTRRTLIDSGVPTLDVAKYESDYVTAVKRGKFESFAKIYEKKTTAGTDIMVSLFKALPSIIQIFTK